MGIIYCFTNKINGKCYFGQSIYDDDTRYKLHKSNHLNPKSKEYDSAIHQAMRKYGFDNFSYRIFAKGIDEISILNILEVYYIDKYNTLVPNGYNIDPGGKNCSRPLTFEQKCNLMWQKAKLTEEEVIELRKAYQNKESPSKIYQEKYKDRLHYVAFLNIWTGKRYQYVMPEVIENGRHTKLNQQIADEIRKRRKEENLSYQKLAEIYHCSKGAVADIIKNRTWKNPKNFVETIP